MSDEGSKCATCNHPLYNHHTVDGYVGFVCIVEECECKEWLEKEITHSES